MEKKDDFKVIDRRGEKDGSPKEKSGDGFTMKGSSSNEAKPNQVDFSTFIFSLATGAYIHLGLAKDPVSGKVETNLALAQQNIDILILLREKTKGNLTSDEESLFKNLLSDIQLRFVEKSKKS